MRHLKQFLGYATRRAMCRSVMRTTAFHLYQSPACAPRRDTCRSIIRRPTTVHHLSSPQNMRRDVPCVAVSYDGPRQCVTLSSPQNMRHDAPCVAVSYDGPRQCVTLSSPQNMQRDAPCVAVSYVGPRQCVTFSSPQNMRRDAPCVAVSYNGPRQCVNLNSPQNMRRDAPCVAVSYDGPRQCDTLSSSSGMGISGYVTQCAMCRSVSCAGLFCGFEFTGQKAPLFNINFYFHCKIRLCLIVPGRHEKMYFAQGSFYLQGILYDIKIFILLIMQRIPLLVFRVIFSPKLRDPSRDLSL